jgi:hypothetical protein
MSLDPGPLPKCRRRILAIVGFIARSPWQVTSWLRHASDAGVSARELTAHLGRVLVGVETGEQMQDTIGEFHDALHPGRFQSGLVGRSKPRRPSMEKFPSRTRL